MAGSDRTRVGLEHRDQLDSLPKFASTLHDAADERAGGRVRAGSFWEGRPDRVARQRSV